MTDNIPDIVARLNAVDHEKINVVIAKALCGWADDQAVWHVLPYMQELVDEIETLRKRLEIDFVWTLVDGEQTTAPNNPDTDWADEMAWEIAQSGEYHCSMARAVHIAFMAEKISLAINDAVAAETERCAKAVCEGCRLDAPLYNLRNDEWETPQDKWTHGEPWPMRCQAAAIRCGKDD